MTTIKPPSGVQPPAGTLQTEALGVTVPKGPTVAGIPAEVPVINPEAVTKALKDYQKIRDKLKQPVLAGAAGLFTDNVVFPSDLLDPKNPANDPKYLHLLLALFGLKEMRQFFETEEQKAEREELEKEEDKEEE